MKIISGNKELEISAQEFKKILDAHLKKKLNGEIEIDLGTGDGRYIYKNGLKHPENFYIGIDPVGKQLQKYSRDAVRKKLTNILFIVSSVENLPKELKKTADTVSILLPWGSLLNYVANCNGETLREIKELLVPQGKINILFGYTHQAEPTETERLDLEKLNERYIKETLIPKYKEIDLECSCMEEIETEKLRDFETSWSKKLSFGKNRPMFLLKFQVK